MISSNHCQSLCAILKSNRRKTVFPMICDGEERPSGKYNAARRSNNARSVLGIERKTPFTQDADVWEVVIGMIRPSTAEKHQCMSSPPSLPLLTQVDSPARYGRISQETPRSNASLPTPTRHPSKRQIYGGWTV